MEMRKSTSRTAEQSRVPHTNLRLTNSGVDCGKSTRRNGKRKRDEITVSGGERRRHVTFGKVYIALNNDNRVWCAN